MRTVPLVLTVLGVALAAPAPHAQQPTDNSGDVPVVLTATQHPLVPHDLSQLWMVPPARHAAGTMAEFAAAVKLEVDADFARALPIFAKPALQQGPLGGYGVYYEGLAQLRTGHVAEARTTFQALEAQQPVGYLAEAAALREGECDETLGEHSAALAVYERLAATKTSAPDDVLMRLARVAKVTGDIEKAANTFARVYYEFPLGDDATQAGVELESLANVQPISPETSRYKLELGRAERLFGAKHYPLARAGFEGLRSSAEGDDKELVQLRLAECDYFMKRARQARDGLRPYVDHASRQGEALFFYALAARDLGDQDEYLRDVRRIVSDFPTQTWAEEALNNLATYYILQDDDADADQVFREMAAKFPAGRYAERAAWKIGWWSYKTGDYADTVRAFEKAAADFPHSDYRPSWIYWAGRAHDGLHESSLAQTRYTLVATDYLNTYYGRLAVTRLGGQTPGRQLVVDTAPDPDAAGGAEDAVRAAPAPANQEVIRALLRLDLYDQALDELRYAQRVWGDSSIIEATVAWIDNARGDLRAGINAMKRAYPQYMAAGGEKLPPELLRIIFPVNYWPLIRRYATEHQLDPYMMAALIAQESNFVPDVRSIANAYGLMQLLPSTGRHYAKTLHMRRFSMSLLTTAEPNLKMGMAYFADLVRQFGGAHYALASYNAGENRVARWISERPGVDREEFIDDIPFPETQYYVKKILGTAEDYRRLYGSDPVAADASTDAEPAVAHGDAPAPAANAKVTGAPHHHVAAAKATVRKPPATTSKKSHTKKRRRTRKSA